MLADGDVSIDETLLQSFRAVLREAHERGVPTREIIETVAAVTGNLLGSGSTSETTLGFARETYQRTLGSWCDAFYDISSQPSPDPSRPLG